VRKLVGALIAIVLALSGSGVAAAAGPAPGAGDAAALTATIFGTLTGRTGGAYADYSFDATAGESGTLTLSFTPADPVTAPAVGLKLYQNGSLLAATNGVSNPPGTVQLSFTAPAAGPVQAQVYNYTDGTTVNYQLKGIGLNQATPTGRALLLELASIGTLSDPYLLEGPLPGTLTGQTGGAFTYFAAPYFGGTQSVTLTFSPTAAAPSLFLTIDQQGAPIATAVGSDTTTPGHLVLSFQSSVHRPVLIRLANDAPNQTVSYTIDMTGAAAP
jgi:hypothetical protein